MTRTADLVSCDACPARRSTSLPFDMADMIAVRLLPAQFARVVGVSKQSVSKWIHAGKVTLGPDGRLDPVKAIQEVLKNTAPTRLRARIFRQAMEGADAMRVEIRALQRKCAFLERELQTSVVSRAEVEAGFKRQLAAAASEREDATQRALSAMRREVLRRFSQLVEAHARSYGEMSWQLEEVEHFVSQQLRGDRA
jgi:hypothetical protein